MYVQTAGPSIVEEGIPWRGLGASAGSAAVGGAISAGVSLATTAAQMWLSSITLSHDADTATTQVVNGLEPLLRANTAAYLAGPGTCADQAAAEGAFLSAYQWLISTKGCGNGAYGSAGNRCISDRFGPNGATDANAQYPWAAYYYAPIANDPRAAGCAAQLAISNPDAALESAIQNLENLFGGSAQQTTAGQFDTTGGSSSGTATSTASVFSETLLGLPIWLWAAGLGIFLIVK